MATKTWTGGSATTNNWTDGGNWGGSAPVAGDDLVFAGTTRLSPVNDFTAGTSFTSLTFSATAGAFSLSGAAIVLTGGVTNSRTTGTVTQGIAVTHATNAPTYSSVSGGTLACTATIANGGLLMTVSGAGTISFTGVISGSGGMTVGVTALTLNATNTFSGVLTVNVGSTVTATGNGAALGGATSSGTMVLNGLVKIATIGTGQPQTRLNTSASGSLTGNGTLEVTTTGTLTNSILLNGNFDLFTGVFDFGTAAASGAGKIQMNGNSNAAAVIYCRTHAAVYCVGGTHNATLWLYGGNTGESLGQLRLDNGTWDGNIVIAGAITGSGDGHLGTNNGTGNIIRGNISESGGSFQLVRVGSASSVLTLAGVNSWTGGTELRGSILAVGNAGSAGALPAGTVNFTATAATLRLNILTGTGSYVFANNLTGSGALQIYNGGSATQSTELTGTNSFTGNISIVTGRFLVKNVAKLGGATKTLSIGPATSLALDGSAGNITIPSTMPIASASTNGATYGLVNLAGDNVVNSTFTMSLGGNPVRIAVDAGTLNMAGSITSSTSSRILVLDGVGNGTISGVIDDVNGPNFVQKSGAGAWTLTNVNTYTGTTTINTNGGTLQVDGSLSTGAVTVNSGGTLSGSGTIGGAVSALGSAVIYPGPPGSAIGLLTFSAGLTMGAPTALTVAINGTGPAADKVAITGTFTVGASSVLNVDGYTNPRTGATFTVATFTTLSGTFAGKPDGTIFNYGLRRLRINYLANSITLTDVGLPSAGLILAFF